jgi:hypothetical protein
LQVAEFADDLLVEALDGYVREESLEALIEQWRVERAELAAQQAVFMADIRKEINEFREESNLRERERDERERQRNRDQDDRDAKMRQWVIGAVSLGFAATSLVVGLLVALG